MKITAYLRVSTDKQAEQGNGLDVQRRAIREWAKANGHRVVSWRADEGISGSNGLDTRVGLGEALTDLQDGTAAAIVVYKLDRLARDLIIQETLLAEIKRIGATPFSTSPAEDSYLTDSPDDPSRKLIRQILGAVSEYERSMIKLRLTNGRAAKARKGGFAYGAPHYGTAAVDRELQPVPTEQAVITRMKQLRAGGMSYRLIAETLNADSVPAKRGDGWHAQTVARVLHRAE